jgi:hypothetical protein
MVLPDDIAERIEGFVAGKRGFPFIARDEIVCLMYLYGRAGGVKTGEEGQVADLAQRTAGRMAADIEGYRNPARLDAEYIRSRYVNRGLQLAVENRAARLYSDPAVLSDCFAQHVAHYGQDYFFGLYGPLKEGELTGDVRPALLGRMVMVCYNRKGEQEFSSHPLIPVYIWFRASA